MDHEYVLRKKLAAAHHIVHYHGWDDLLATHLSARIPNTDQLLITPMNVPFEAVCASNLIKCDYDGNILIDNGQKLMSQAINIHGELYKQCDHIMSAMHTHSINGVAVSSLACGLLFLNQQAMRFYQDVAYHEFGGLALENEGEAIAQSLQDNKVMILKNHGLLTTGPSIEVAMYLLYYLEIACEIQIRTLSANQKVIELSHDVCADTKAQFDSILSPELEFTSLTRRIENKSMVDFRS